MIILVPLVSAIIGVLMYALATNGKLVEIGRILFWTGWLVFLMQLGPQWVTLIHGK